MGLLGQHASGPPQADGTLPAVIPGGGADLSALAGLAPQLQSLFAGGGGSPGNLPTPSASSIYAGLGNIQSTQLPTANPVSIRGRI